MTPPPPPSASAAPLEFGLPTEPQAQSEILTAEHLFAVEVRRADYSDWRRREDGQAERTIELEFALGENLKGRLDMAEGTTFKLTAAQVHQDTLTEGDDPSIWTHVEPKAGERYLVAARSPLQSPPELIKDGVCIGLFPAGCIEETRLAQQGENIYRKALGKGDEPKARKAAADALIAFTQEHSAECGEFYGTYFWDRVGATFLELEGVGLESLYTLMADPKLDWKFKGLLAGQIADGTTLFEPKPEVLAQIARALVTILTQESAAKLHARLIYIPLYQVVLKDDQPRLKSGDVFKSDAFKNAVKAALDKYPSDRATRIAQWVGP